MKYKIIGIIDCLFGSLISLQAAAFLFIVLPKLTTLYRETGLNTPQPNSSYFLSAAMIILGLASIFLGYTQFTLNKQRYFKWALIIFVMAILSIGFYTSQSVGSVIYPIYNLTINL